jgi:regulator of protease activity HflC (stomatin/prohibitin superfamily)
MTKSSSPPERVLNPTSGWPVLGAWALGVAVAVYGLVQAHMYWKIAPGVMALVLFVCLFGFYIVNPNQSRVLVLFGRYVGSVRREGFFWTNPFTLKHGLSLRAHNLDGSTLKVNDLMGNPVEISAVVVWRVNDTSRARFEVEDYEHYVQVQSDAAVRQIATSYPYDDLHAEGAELTLRGSTDEIAKELTHQLSERLASAGVEVIEARLNHLAYAPEIASAMLQRQQAKAIIAARRQIVEGAVGMVDMALHELNEQHILELDDERKATLVGNLLVILCGQANAQPVLNTGGLYN